MEEGGTWEWGRRGGEPHILSSELEDVVAKEGLVTYFALLVENANTTPLTHTHTCTPHHTHKHTDPIISAKVL